MNGEERETSPGKSFSFRPNVYLEFSLVHLLGKTIIYMRERETKNYFRSSTEEWGRMKTTSVFAFVSNDLGENLNPDKNIAVNFM